LTLDDDLDRILSGEPEMVPPVNFAAMVMNAVRIEAEIPPPIPFPWLRAMPAVCAGAVAAVMVVVILGIMLLHLDTRGQAVPVGLESAVAEVIQGWNAIGANWIVLALMVSAASVTFSTRVQSIRRAG
jgi:hypothetical protein